MALSKEWRIKMKKLFLSLTLLLFSMSSVDAMFWRKRTTEAKEEKSARPIVKFKGAVGIREPEVVPIAQSTVVKEKKWPSAPPPTPAGAKIEVERKSRPVLQSALKAEDNLLFAIKNKDLAAAKAAIDAGAPLNEIKSLFGYIGTIPVQMAYKSGAYTIAEYLISKGADTTPLNYYLLSEATSANVTQVEWLLKHGAKDIDDKVLAEVKDFHDDEVDSLLKVQYAQIIKLLEQAKQESQRLKSVMPSKGIFEELETEEFLGKK